MFIVFNLRKNAFSENVSAVFLPQFVANLNQHFSRRFLAARSDLIANDVGKRVIVEALLLEIFRYFAFACRVPASKSY